MSYTSPVDYFLAVGRELERLETLRAEADDKIRECVGRKRKLPPGMFLEVRDRERYQDAINFRVNILLRHKNYNVPVSDFVLTWPGRNDPVLMRGDRRFCY
jgi:hypothetical protein